VPDEFEGSTKHYTELRSAIIALYDTGVKSQELINESKASLSRSSLDRFRKGYINRINSNAAARLWQYIQNSYPVIFANPTGRVDNPSNEHILFFHLKQFFDLKSHRCSDFSEKFGGNFKFFHKSEIFQSHERVISGLWRIECTDDGAIWIAEKQAYDGRFGLDKMNEDHFGYCLPKSGIQIFIMKNLNAFQPKMYFIEEYKSNTHNNEVDFIKGNMISFSSSNSKYFKSNFLAKRISNKDEFKPSIIERAELRDPFIDRWVFEDE